MKVALIQMNSGADKMANLAAARELIERAVLEEKPDWVCLPEVFDFMGGSRAEKQAAAEVLPGGPAWTMLRDLARKHGIFIHGGSILESIPGEDRVGNTTVVFNRSGEELARYRKIHMFDITAPDGQQYNESAAMKPGEAVVTYDVEGVTVGCSICYDLRFPDLFQALVARGAQMIALPAAFHAADRQGPLGSAVARPRHRDGNLHVRCGPDRNAHAGQRAARDLWSFARRRSMGTCGRARLRRRRLRRRAH